MTITGLTSSTTYSVRVSAVNGVSNQSNIPIEFDEGQFVTKASTQTIQHFQISSRNQAEVTVTWDIVPGIRNQVLFYQVKSAPRLGGYGDIFLKNTSSTHQNYTFKNLNLGTEYSLQVGFQVSELFQGPIKGHPLTLSPSLLHTFPTPPKFNFWKRNICTMQKVCLRYFCQFIFMIFV